MPQTGDAVTAGRVKGMGTMEGSLLNCGCPRAQLTLDSHVFGHLGLDESCHGPANQRVSATMGGVAVRAKQLWLAARGAVQMG
jgi:hypothetical protein